MNLIQPNLYILNNHETSSNILVLRKDMEGYKRIFDLLVSSFDNVVIKILVGIVVAVK